MATVTTPTPDPLLETQVFWERNKGAILGVLAAVLLAVAAYGAYRWYVSHRDNSAATVLAQAKGAGDYQKVIDEFPSSPAASSGYLLLAAAQRKEQKLAEANATLKTFIDRNPKHELVTTAKMAMAANVEALGKPYEALEMYRGVAADYPRSFNAPLAMLAEVPLLKAKGDTEGARRVAETVLTQYRESFAATEATRHLRMLKVSTPAGPLPGEGISDAEKAALQQTAAAAAAAAAGSANLSASATP